MGRETRCKGLPWQGAALPWPLHGSRRFGQGFRRVQAARSGPVPATTGAFRTCKSPGLKARALHARPAYAGQAQFNQATFLKTLVTLSLIGSTVSVVTFWASAVSSLLCALSVSNCLRICEVESSTASDSDFTVIS